MHASAERDLILPMIESVLTEEEAFGQRAIEALSDYDISPFGYPHETGRAMMEAHRLEVRNIGDACRIFLEAGEPYDRTTRDRLVLALLRRYYYQGEVIQRSVKNPGCENRTEFSATSFVFRTAIKVANIALLLAGSFLIATSGYEILAAVLICLAVGWKAWRLLDNSREYSRIRTIQRSLYSCLTEVKAGIFSAEDVSRRISDAEPGTFVPSVVFALLRLNCSGTRSDDLK